MNRPRTKFILSLDTEEDNWGNYSARSASLSNIAEIPEFHRRCRELGVRPTYLLTYPIVMDPASSELFADLEQAAECEIGSHCHPWNTPPFDETPSARNSMLCNLPFELQAQKVRTLTEEIANRFGMRPKSFRAGRWGIGRALLPALAELGYSVDSSIIPLQNWAPISGSDFSSLSPQPFWDSASDVFEGASRTRGLCEIPVTVGFLQQSSRSAEKLFRTASTLPFRKLHAVGILERLSLANRVALLPEIYSLDAMIQLTERLLEQDVEYLNFTFHSCTLSKGLTPFTRTAGELTQFKRKVYSYLEYIQKLDLSGVTLCEASGEILSGGGASPVTANCRASV